MSTASKRLTLLLALVLTATACSSPSNDDSSDVADASATTVDLDGVVDAATSANPNYVVRAIQESLDVLGYDVGVIDGVAGPKSRDALADFQSDSGLESTGNLDGATTIALSEASPDARHYIVEAVQTQLAELGYYTDIIDGAYGPATEAALIDFHEEEQIDQSHEISEATLTRLGDVYVTDVLIPTLEANGYTPPDAPEGNPEDFQRQGDESSDIQTLQERLIKLGYRPGDADGRFGAHTTSAVLAFQKREGLQRDGIVGPVVLAQLENPEGAGANSASGPRIEVDLDRQIAFIIESSGQTTTINISSGSGREYNQPNGSTAVAYTPTGEFVVERVIDGNREAPLGSLYRPVYFKEGWAVHGSPNVPAYPASHGCVRTSNYDQDFVFPRITVDDPVHIYGTSLGEPDKGAPGF